MPSTLAGDVARRLALRHEIAINPESQLESPFLGAEAEDPESVVRQPAAPEEAQSPELHEGRLRHLGSVIESFVGLPEDRRDW